MEIPVIKLKEFEKNRSYELFAEIMDIIYPNATKCKECGKHIYYYDTCFYGWKRPKKDKKLKIHINGKSFLTQKTHGEKLVVCEKCLKINFPKYKQKRTFNSISDITCFAFDIKDRSLYFSNPSEERCVNKHGKEKGLEIWKNYRKKQSEKNTFEYKNKKYGMTREEFIVFNKSRAVTLTNLIKKYGKEEGTKKWNEYIERQRETKTLDYMIKKFGEEQANQINKSKGITLDNFIQKHGEKEGTKRFIKIINKQRSFYSKISQCFFDDIDNTLGKKFTTYYATKNTEYGVNLSIGYVKLDYFVEELNLCIEFNGDLFHANPAIFKENDKPNPYNKNLSSKEIWKNDNIRYAALKNEKNINTIIIWQSEYKTLDINEFINSIIKEN